MTAADTETPRQGPNGHDRLLWIGLLVNVLSPVSVIEGWRDKYGSPSPARVKTTEGASK